MNGPVCVKCEVRMARSKIGVNAELMAGKEGYQIWSGDLYRCPLCDFEVLTGFGFKPVAERFAVARYAVFLKTVVFRFWSTARELREGRDVKNGEGPGEPVG